MIFIARARPPILPLPTMPRGDHTPGGLHMATASEGVESSPRSLRLAWASCGVGAVLFVALLAPAVASADITNGGAHVQQIFNSWARPIAACMIVAGAIRAIARRNLVGIVTFLALVLALGGFVISPDRGLNVSNSLLGKVLD